MEKKGKKQSLEEIRKIIDDFVRNAYRLRFRLKIEDIDVEDIDLSGASINVQDIHNCNFHNSNLCLVMNLSEKQGWEKQDYSFIDCDLRGNKIEFLNCTKSYRTHIYLINVLLDEEQIKKFNSLIENDHCLFFADYATIKKNKGLRIHASVALSTIGEQLYSNKPPKIIQADEAEQKVLIIESILKEINSSQIKKLYNCLAGQMTSVEKVQMFVNKTITGKTIRNLVIDEEMYSLLEHLETKECKCENVIFDLPSTMITNNYIRKYLREGINIDEIINSKFPTLKLDVWNPSTMHNYRFGDTPVTIRHNLYLELGRQCNANCVFCRNKCMKEVKYNFKRIMRELNRYVNDSRPFESLIDLFDTIYVGGGEPTLRIEDLKELLSLRYVPFTVISNGTTGLNELACSIPPSSNIKYMVSRHSYDDSENAAIFGIDKKHFNNLCFIPDIYSCTCLKGGMDSVEKILKYIDYVLDEGFSDIIFTSLMDGPSIYSVRSNKANKSLNIDPDVFERVISILKEKGMKENSYPIVSSSGYILRILKVTEGSKRSIAFKRYLGKKEFEELWLSAVKRTYDLTMSPDGNLYSSWNGKKLVRSLSPVYYDK